MEGSEDQFQELIAQLIGRVNRMLASGQPLLPVGLLLLPDGRLDISVATYETTDQIPSLASAMIRSMGDKAIRQHAIASCVAYPEGPHGIVAFLENADNFCLSVRFPVANGSNCQIDMEAIEANEGVIQVFALAES